jgi:N-acetyl-anhydromuramyl-L-alanine amidase AmpD
MNIQQIKSPNCSHRRNNMAPDIVVCHITEGSYSGAVSWLCNPASEASSTVVIARDGRVVQLVDINMAPWTNGTSTKSYKPYYYKNSTSSIVRSRPMSANHYSLTIEFEGILDKTNGRLTPEQIASGAEVLQYFKREVKRIYGTDLKLDREHVLGHCEVAPKWKPYCPGPEFPYDELLAKANGTDQLVDDLNYLVGVGAISSPEYWIANAINGGYCKGEYTAKLIRGCVAKMKGE